MQNLQGFTLTELMVTLAILAILISIAVPGMRSLLVRQELNGQTTNLVNTLAYARNIAVSRVVKVVLCGTSDGTTCNDSSDLSDGWMVFVDSDNNNVFSSGDELLKRGGDGPKSTSVSLNNADKFISFSEDGDGEAIKKIELCAENAGSNSDKSRTVTISLVGSSRISHGANCP